MLRFPNKTHTGRGVVFENGIFSGKTYLGKMVNITLEECVGVGFDIRLSNLLETVDCQITLVKKNVHTWRDFLPWFILLNFYILIIFVSWATFWTTVICLDCIIVFDD